jgi:hypothetical protein
MIIRDKGERQAFCLEMLGINESKRIRYRSSSLGSSSAQFSSTSRSSRRDENSPGAKRRLGSRPKPPIALSNKLWNDAQSWWQAPSSAREGRPSRRGRYTSSTEDILGIRSNQLIRRYLDV